MSNRFYVYLLKRQDGSYYVGKGKDDRWKASMKQHNCDKVRFIHNTKDEDEAFRLEDKIWRGMVKRKFRVINKTRPGRYGQQDQRSGWHHSEEVRKRIGLSLRLNNKARCEQLTLDGLTLTVREWSERLNMAYGTINSRLRKGWPVERILNSETSRMITYDGETLSISELALQYGLTSNRLRQRLRMGWLVEEALTTPLLPTSHNHRLRGSQNSKAKLTEQKVVEIRELHKAGNTCTRIAEKFSVDITLISQIVNGRIWKHVST